MGMEQARRMEPARRPTPRASSTSASWWWAAAWPGLTAALEAARAGYAVTLVEKRTELGGFRRRSSTARIPQQPALPAARGDRPRPRSSTRSARTKLVEVLTSAEVQKIEGGPCKFEVTLSRATARRAA